MTIDDLRARWPEYLITTPDTVSEPDGSNLQWFVYAHRLGGSPDLSDAVRSSGINAEIAIGLLDVALGEAAS